MRGLLLISMLLALGVVGYMTVTPGPDGESQVDKARQAEKRVDAVRDEVNATQKQRMDRLREQTNPPNDR